MSPTHSTCRRCSAWRQRSDSNDWRPRRARLTAESRPIDELRSVVARQQPPPPMRGGDEHSLSIVGDDLQAGQPSMSLRLPPTLLDRPWAGPLADQPAADASPPRGLIAIEFPPAGRGCGHLPAPIDDDHAPAVVEYLDRQRLDENGGRRRSRQPTGPGPLRPAAGAGRRHRPRPLVEIDCYCRYPPVPVGRKPTAIPYRDGHLVFRCQRAQPSDRSTGSAVSFG